MWRSRHWRVRARPQSAIEHGVYYAYAAPVVLCFECIRVLDRHLCEQRSPPDFHGNTSAIVDTISAQTVNEGEARLIYDALQGYFGPETSNLKSLRVTVSHQFARDEAVCTLVEWRDRADARFLAIFTFDPDDQDRCNYLVYSSSNPGGKKCENGNYVYWNLSDLSALTTLLEAAQHVVGILELSKSDIGVLYCGNRDDTCQPEEYCPYEKLSDFV
jgi:hypothetical protein